jgi:hypothetical protein
MLGYGLAGTLVVVLLIVLIVRALWTHSSGRVRQMRVQILRNMPPQARSHCGRSVPSSIPSFRNAKPSSSRASLVVEVYKIEQLFNPGNRYSVFKSHIGTRSWVSGGNRLWTLTTVFTDSVTHVSGRTRQRVRPFLSRRSMAALATADRDSVAGGKDLSKSWPEDLMRKDPRWKRS